MIASSSASSRSLTRGCQNRVGASQKLIYNLDPFINSFGEAITGDDESDSPRKSEKRCLSSVGAAGCG